MSNSNKELLRKLNINLDGTSTEASVGHYHISTWNTSRNRTDEKVVRFRFLVSEITHATIRIFLTAMEAPVSATLSIPVSGGQSIGKCTIMTQHSALIPNVLCSALDGNYLHIYIESKMKVNATVQIQHDAPITIEASKKTLDSDGWLTINYAPSISALIPGVDFGSTPPNTDLFEGRIFFVTVPDSEETTS